MGILAIIAFSVFVSIYYRRKRSAKRDKIREAQEASLRPPTPEMRGVHAFIPRYFPGAARPPSITSSLHSTRSTSSSSIGPSHGLNYPIAPDVPSYTSPSPRPRETVMTEAVPIPLAIALRPGVSRLPDDDDLVPPSYNDVHQNPLLIVPAYSPPEPSLPTSSSSPVASLDSTPTPSSSEDGMSTSLLIPERQPPESTHMRQSQPSAPSRATSEQPLIPTHTILDDRLH